MPSPRPNDFLPYPETPLFHYVTILTLVKRIIFFFQDIDECLQDPNPCGDDPDMFCYNTRGGYRCNDVTCPAGYSKVGVGIGNGRRGQVFPRGKRITI